MQTAPKNIKVKDIEVRILKQMPCVISIPKFHIWQLTGDKIISSIHVVCNTFDDYMSISNQLKDFLYKEGECNS